MLLSLDRLIDGVIATLREEVLPDVATARARSRVWAVVDVLANLRNRIEERAAYARAEAESAADALREFSSAMRAEGRRGDADAVDAALGAALASHAAALDLAAALREVVLDALKRSRDATGPDVPAARAALESHLAAQAIRDVLPLKPSPLAEISKG